MFCYVTVMFECDDGVVSERRKGGKMGLFRYWLVLRQCSLWPIPPTPPPKKVNSAELSGLHALRCIRFLMKMGSLKLVRVSGELFLLLPTPHPPPPLKYIRRSSMPITLMSILKGNKF